MRMVYLCGYLTFLFAPILIIVLFSFHSSPALVFPIQGLSTQWFRQLFDNTQMLHAFYNSAKVGAFTALASAILGTFAALAMLRLKGRVKEIFAFFNFLPITLPGLFMGIALLVFFALLGINRSLFTITLAHVLFTLPFFVEAMRPRVEWFDLSLEEAARDLGASSWTAFRKVTIPIIAPSIMGASILVFALSFDEFLVTIFVAGNESTLPMFIWSMLRRTVNPMVNSVSVITLLVSVTALLAVALIYSCQRRKKLLRHQSIYS